MKQAGLYLMALLYIGAGVLHFVVPKFYLRIMPPYLPAHHLLVALSGVAEVIVGVGLLIPATRVWAAWADDPAPDRDFSGECVHGLRSKIRGHFSLDSLGTPTAPGRANLVGLAAH
jgi:hypothetical protein